MIISVWPESINTNLTNLTNLTNPTNLSHHTQGLLAQAEATVNLVEDDHQNGSSIKMDEDFGTALNNFTLCCQMFFFAVGHM